jgi:hypothetical protein
MVQGMAHQDDKLAKETPIGILEWFLTKISKILATVKAIISKNGLRGLYRGYWLTLLTFGPSSAVWWAVYSSTRGN